MATLKDWEENTSLSLDALLLDLTEPEAESLAEVLALGETNQAPIVVLLAQNAEWPVPDLLQSGVQGVLPGDATGPEILAALERPWPG
ncbi:MAG: hypothetical protein HC922_05290 [Leptolyngbyaceae cyanobacterium SM2_3_12]|nr:hypothetical protein [Leptolyngbyaceae cyanobacterium SM2_3_12]